MDTIAIILWGFVVDITEIKQIVFDRYYFSFDEQ